MKQIPVISINMSGLEKNPGFKISPQLVMRGMYGTFVNTAEANSFYQSDAYDAAYTKAISADNEADQWEAYKECDSILSEDLPVSVILHSMSTYLFDDTDYEGLVYSCGNFVFTYLKAL